MKTYTVEEFREQVIKPELAKMKERGEQPQFVEMGRWPSG
jgi:hypothetical protein